MYSISLSWIKIWVYRSSPLSTGELLRACWPAISLSGTGTVVQQTRKTLQRRVNTATKIIGAPLPSILEIFLTCCSSKATSIVKNPTHPSHSLFQILPSGRRYPSIRARSARLLNSFFPQAESPELKSPHPSLKTQTNPLPPERWTITPPPPPPNTPQPYHIIEKTVWKCFVQFEVCYTQVSGPVQTTCRNTLSSIRTRYFSPWA